MNSKTPVTSTTPELAEPILAKTVVRALKPHLLLDCAGRALVTEANRSRFSWNEDLCFHPLKPKLIAEIKYDQPNQPLAYNLPKVFV